MVGFKDRIANRRVLGKFKCGTASRKNRHLGVSELAPPSRGKTLRGSMILTSITVCIYGVPPKALTHVKTNTKRKELDEQSKPNLSTVNGSAVPVHQFLKNTS